MEGRRRERGMRGREGRRRERDEGGWREGGEREG